MSGTSANRRAPIIRSNQLAAQISAIKIKDRNSESSAGEESNYRKKIFVAAGNGTAFRLNETADGVEPETLKTSKPAFKAFGLTADGRKLLYTPLKNGAPSGKLYLEDLTTGKSRKVTDKLILNAALSPPDENKIAYIFATGDSFGLAVTQLDKQSEKIAAAEDVFTEILRWDADGAGIYYFANEVQATGSDLEIRYAAADFSAGAEIKQIEPKDAPRGFPVPEKRAEPARDEFEKLIHGVSRPETYAFRLDSPDAGYEIESDNLFGSGNLTVREKISGETVALGKGQFVDALETGVVIREFSENRTNLKFVDWRGTEQNLGATIVNFNFPLENSTLIQGGTGYSAPGNCAITAHSGAMEFAYDFQSTTVGAHALASAAGLVVYNTSSVTCNTIDTNGCADYNPNGCPGTFLGNVLVIQHADGTFTKYAHMQHNSLQAAVGTNVCQGLYIGRQGHTGSTNGDFNGCGDHLHFERQSSPDIFGQSIAVNFSDATSNPLSCGTNYTSASTEAAHSIAINAGSFGVSGGKGSANLTSTGCVWSAASNNNWITITSAPSGSGNSLVTFEVADNSGGSPRTGTMNLGGHVFTVTQSGEQPPNEPPVVSAGSDQTITLPSAANLSGTASDDGLPNPPGALATAWSKISGPGAVAFGNANSLNTTANFGAAGIYVLRLTASDGDLSVSDDLTIVVNTLNGGGILSGSRTEPPSSVDLTSEGTSDWTHWGLNSGTSLNRKNGVPPQIGNFTQIGSVAPLRYANNPNFFSWTDGTPTSSATDTATGLYVYEPGNGFQITVPADTNQRTLKLYVGLWAAGGRLEATLSDGSASPFIDTSLNSPNVQNGVYTLNFKAATAGQTLTVRWLVGSSLHPVGNVTLQAAALTGSGGHTPAPNQAPIVNAGSDLTITLPAAAQLNGSVSDDGLPNPPSTLRSTWSLTSGRGKVKINSANSPVTNVNFAASGIYKLRLTAKDGALASFDEVTVTVRNPSPRGETKKSANREVSAQNSLENGTGTLNIAAAAPPAAVNLTSEGTADWVHWGLTSPNAVNRKNTAASQISNFSALGSGTIQQYPNNPNSYSWTDGTPNLTANSTTAGVYVIGADNGFEITVPADTTERTLKLYVGLWAAGGRLEASLSDASAANLLDTSLVNAGGTSNQVYSLTYKAGSGGQSLTVRWTVGTTFNNWSNVTLQAAALTVNTPPVNQPPSVDAGIDQTIFLPAAANVSGTLSDDGLPNSPAALTASWSSVGGRGRVSFSDPNALDTTAMFAAAGTYILRLTATDGEYTVSDDVIVTVNVPGSGGLIQTSGANVPANVNLTSEGTTDWVHWGLASPADFNRKNIAAPQISDFTPVGNGTIQRFTNNASSYSWSDGAPTAIESAAASGVYVIGADNGFEITVPADTTERTLKLYVGLWAAGGRLEASLSDASAANLLDTSLVNAGGTSNQVYSLTYKAGSGGQSLTVRWTVGTTFNNWSNVTLQAATLFEGSPPPPISSEFQINSSVSASQYVTHTATDANGNFIVVWHSSLQDGSGWGIFARRYDPAGNPLGSEFQVNTYTTDNQFSPRVASDSNGNFTIVWESKNEDGNGYGIYAQRFDSSGAFQGGEFRVSTTTAADQHDPYLAMAPNGDFVVVWVSDAQDGNMMGIFGQRYNSSGAPQGGEFQINTYTTGDQRQPGIAMDASGNFTVVWESFGQDGSGSGIYTRQFDAAGNPLGGEFRVNTFTAGDQSSSWISMNAAGDFVVVWSSAGQDGSGSGIFGQRFNAAGAPQGAEFQANTYSLGDQIYSTTAMVPDGGFVVGWESVGQDGSGRGVYLQRFDASGVRQSGEFQINTHTTDNQFSVYLTTGAGGNFIAAWISYGQDGSAEGIFGKRFDAAGNPLAN